MGDVRIKFMILDVIELRENNWQVRRKKNVATTINKVHQTYEQDKRELARPGRPVRSTNTRPSGPSKPTSSNKLVDSDGWQTATSSSKPVKHQKPQGKQPTTENRYSVLTEASPATPPPSQSNIPSKENLVCSSIQNFTTVVLDEYFASRELEEAVLSVKRDVLPPGKNLVDDQAQFMADSFSYIFKKNKQPNDIVLLFEALFNADQLTTGGLSKGFGRVITGLDEAAESIPVAPSRVGFAIAKLKKYMPGKNPLSFIKTCLPKVENPSVQSSLITAIFSTLEESEPGLDLNSLGLDLNSKFFTAYCASNLKKKLSGDLELCYEWAKDNLQPSMRGESIFTREICAVIPRNFSRGWNGDDLSEKDLEDERQLIQSYMPLLQLFCVSPEAKEELHRFCNKRTEA